MFSGLISSLKRFRSEVVSYATSDEILQQITELKKEELFAGKRGDGQKITPNYEDIPEFRGWYLEFKKTLPTYQLGDGTPDLFIDGTFHSSLYTKNLTIGVYETLSDYSKPFMLDVVEMHKGNGTLLDLTDENKEVIANNIEAFIIKNFNV